MKLRISEAAAQDIEEIYLYGFLNFGEAQADHYAEGLRNALQLLCSSPFIGRLDGRVNPAVRRFEFERHVIFYDAAQSEIVIVRVLHRSMDFINYL
jgi:toxin ParE1/3/4